MYKKKKKRATNPLNVQPTETDIDQDYEYQPESSSSLQQRLLIHTCAFKGSRDEHHMGQRALGNKHLSEH